MSTRRFLILVPLALSLLLLQSYFWVPTYDEQARGNPGRLEEYINASIGDASILNPILSADSASSEIDNQVFEGLIDRDENLRFRGRVAKAPPGGQPPNRSPIPRRGQCRFHSGKELG